MVLNENKKEIINYSSMTINDSKDKLNPKKMKLIWLGLTGFYNKGYKSI